MSSLLLLLLLILLMDVFFAESNLTLTNSSSYFKISRSDIMTLRNNNYQGITANISVAITYQIENNTENILINDLLSESFQQTIKNKYPSIGDEQIVIYQINTFLQETLNNKSKQFTSTIFTAFLAYSLEELEDINTFTVSTLGNELQNMLNYTLRNNMKSLQSVVVNINETQINNVKIDTNDLYNNPSDGNTDTDTKKEEIESELLYIFIAVAIIILLLIICVAVCIIKRRFNDKISDKLELLEKSLLEHSDGQYMAPKIQISSSPVVREEGKDIIGGHNRNQSRLEMQLKSKKSNSYNRAKITSYDTLGYDGENDEDEEDENDNPDVVNDEIDDYLAQSDDDENDDMYTMDITTHQ